eukprot:9221218-Pyramimonas_sp.AAC.1
MQSTGTGEPAGHAVRPHCSHRPVSAVKTRRARGGGDERPFSPPRERCHDHAAAPSQSPMAANARRARGEAMQGPHQGNGDARVP